MPETSNTPAPERRLLGRIGANKRWSHVPLAERSAATEPARTAAIARFETEVDPDGQLDPAERHQLARQAQRAHMQKIALRSARARRLRAAGGQS
jgi:hypothetical protein